jgi:hypothetical protein
MLRRASTSASTTRSAAIDGLAALQLGVKKGNVKAGIVRHQGRACDER